MYSVKHYVDSISTKHREPLMTCQSVTKWRGVCLGEITGSIYDRALMIWIKSGLRDAPPTRKPSISGCPASSRQFAAVTEPVNTKRTHLKYFLFEILTLLHDLNKFKYKCIRHLFAVFNLKY